MMQVKRVNPTSWTMAFARVLISASLAIVAFTSLAGGQAPDSSYPVRLLDRPTTLPRGTSRLDVVVIASRQPTLATAWTGYVGGGVGIFGRLEVGGQIVPIALDSGDLTFSSPSIYATSQLSVGRASLAPTVQIVYPLASSDPFYLDVGVPVSFNIGTNWAASIAPTLSMNTRANGSGTSLSVPVTLVRQVSQQVNWQLSSGVGLSRFDPRFGLSRRSDAIKFDDVTVPLSAQITYSFRRGVGRHPLADVTLQGLLPQLYTNVSGQRGIHVNDWTVQLQLSAYAIK